jgi:hypothetical protein
LADGYYQRGAEVAREAPRVTEKPDAHQKGPGSADAGPYRVGRAKRYLPLRQKQQRSAYRHCRNGKDRPDDQPSGLLRPFQPERPAHFA